MKSTIFPELSHQVENICRSPTPLLFVACRFKGTDEWLDGQLSMLYISISFAHLSFFVCIIWSNRFGEMTGEFGNGSGEFISLLY
jgi:hypothetical protein